MSLNKTLYMLLSADSTQEETDMNENLLTNIRHQHKQKHMIPNHDSKEYAVNSEIFARILLSQIVLKEIFATLKIRN